MSDNRTVLTTDRLDETFTSGIIDDSISKGILACQVVEIAIFLFTSWILSCSIIYGFKTKKWRKRPGSNNLDQGIMYSCCVAAIAVTLPRILFTIVLLFTDLNISTSTCKALMTASNVLNFSATYPSYLYLWLRQKAIYSHPVAQRLAGKGVTFLGWAVLFVMTIVSLAIGCVYLAQEETYVGSPNGCIKNTEMDKYQSWYYIYGSIFAIAQLSLLALFIYPMIRCTLDQMKFQSATLPPESRKQAMSVCTVCRTILCGNRERNSEQSSSLTRTIRRSLYAALVAIMSDITVTAIVSIYIPTTAPRRIVNVHYDFNLLIHSLCILSTFGNNRKILRVCWVESTDAPNERTNQESTKIDIDQVGDEAGNKGVLASSQT